MTPPKKPADEVLRDAERAQPRESLSEHQQTIQVLRKKNYTWRQVAQFLNERGVETDHTRVFRFMKQNQGESSMDAPVAFAVPSAELYKEALVAIEPELTKAQRAMLAFHYGVHNRTATFTQLADAAGYGNSRSAHRYYGNLGERLGREIGMRFDTYTLKGKEVPFFSSAIASGSHFREEETGYFQLIMHHELAKALNQLGWFRE